MKKIIIVGAGVSGVYLAILLKQKLNDQIDVTVLEQNSSSLKKLLATGNGRCNLSNQDMSIDYYQSDNNQIVDHIIHSFDMSKEMEKLGLICRYHGKLLYPYSEQALSVKNILMGEALRHNVSFVYDEEVIDVAPQYIISTQKSQYSCDYVIFAMGSEAGKLSGVRHTRYHILKKLGLNIVPTFPSLVQMTTQPALKQLKGVRVKGLFSLLEKGQCIHQEKGELLFTDYGVSGIAVMQLSAFFQQGHQYELSIRLFDDLGQDKLRKLIEDRIKKDYNHIYDGLMNSKLAIYFEKQNISSISQMTNQLYDMRLKVTGLRSFETAQVMKGGLSLGEVYPSLELKRYPHMYAVGEILNVAGMCGGYNLHFALASAKNVALEIVRDFYDKNS
jgi:predicted Rossmann fold flavoprotein